MFAVAHQKTDCHVKRMLIRACVHTHAYPAYGILLLPYLKIAVFHCLYVFPSAHVFIGSFRVHICCCVHPRFNCIDIALTATKLPPPPPPPLERESEIQY